MRELSRCTPLARTPDLKRPLMKQQDCGLKAQARGHGYMTSGIASLLKF
jgi:hypothetical protein